MYSSVLWGYYLIQLANKAFTVAQSQDPGYVAAWIGQAIIAQNIGHADCMDLYRHTTELDYHVSPNDMQSCICAC